MAHDNAIQGDYKPRVFAVGGRDANGQAISAANANNQSQGRSLPCIKESFTADGRQFAYCCSGLLNRFCGTHGGSPQGATAVPLCEAVLGACESCAQKGRSRGLLRLHVPVELLGRLLRDFWSVGDRL
jgi:hypothetical protein